MLMQGPRAEQVPRQRTQFRIVSGVVAGAAIMGVMGKRLAPLAAVIFAGYNRPR